MEPLSIWEMFWQLGCVTLVAVPLIVLVGGAIFLMFKPINYFDRL